MTPLKAMSPQPTKDSKSQQNKQGNDGSRPYHFSHKFNQSAVLGLLRGSSFDSNPTHFLALSERGRNADWL